MAPQSKDEDSLMREMVNLVNLTVATHASTGYTQIDLSSPQDPFCRLHNLIEEVKRVQAKRVGGTPHINQAAAFDRMVQWMKENKVDVDAFPVRIASGLGDEGSGLVAKRDLQQDEMLLSIPSKLMMSLDSATKNGVDDIKAKVLEQIPSVKLALHLWLEQEKGSSFWKPYIDTLPRQLNLPVFWSLEELKSLRGTCIQGDAVKTVVTTAMQFFHIFQQFQAQDLTDKMLTFTLERWFWCVAIVMSRQNMVPLQAGSRPQPTLIPFWDLFNHTQGTGEITTYWNHEKQAMESFSMQEAKEADQVYIFYGHRNNSMLLLYQGFVYPENRQDFVSAPYALIQDDDKLKPAKTAFLMKHQTHNKMLAFRKGEALLESRAMFAARTAAADISELKALNGMEKPVGQEVSLDNEVKAVDMLLKGLEYIQELREMARSAPTVEEVTEGTANTILGNTLYELEEQIITATKEELKEAKAKLKKRIKNRKKKQQKKQKAVMTAVVDDVD